MIDQETKIKSPDSSSKSLRLWHKLLIGFLVLLAVLIVIVYAATSGVTKISNEYINDIQAKDADAAYALMTKGAQAVTSKQAFRELVNKIGPVLNTNEKMTSKEAKGETGQVATGKVTYEIKGTDGVTYHITVNLQKEDGKWRVQNFESKE